MHVDIVVGAVQGGAHHGVGVHRLKARLEDGEVIQEVRRVELVPGKQGVVVTDGDQRDVRIQGIDALDDGPVVHEIAGLGLDTGLGDDRDVGRDLQDGVQRGFRLFQRLTHAAELFRLLEEAQLRHLGNLAGLSQFYRGRQDGEPDVIEPDAEGDEVCLFDGLLVEGAQLLVVLHGVLALVLAARRGKTVQRVGDIRFMAVAVVGIGQEHPQFFAAHAGLCHRVHFFCFDGSRHPVDVGAGYTDEVVRLRLFRLVRRLVGRCRDTGRDAVAEARDDVICFDLARAGCSAPGFRERRQAADRCQHQCR